MDKKNSGLDQGLYCASPEKAASAFGSPGPKLGGRSLPVFQASQWERAALPRVPSQRQARWNPNLIRMMAMVAAEDISGKDKSARRPWQREVFSF
jgi:hypothetical protein